MKPNQMMPHTPYRDTEALSNTRSYAPVPFLDAGGSALGVCRGKVRQTPKRAGFTLIEVLVALAIVSIALLAALRAAGLGTNSVSELRSRLLASWVAENLLAEHRARGDWLPLGLQRGTGRQGGRDFVWREEVVATPNSSFRRVDIRVFAANEESRSLAHLVGFVVHPPGTAK